MSKAFEAHDGSSRAAAVAEPHRPDVMVQPPVVTAAVTTGVRGLKRKGAASAGAKLRSLAHAPPEGLAPITPSPRGGGGGGGGAGTPSPVNATSPFFPPPSAQAPLGSRPPLPSTGSSNALTGGSSRRLSQSSMVGRLRPQKSEPASSFRRRQAFRRRRPPAARWNRDRKCLRKTCARRRRHPVWMVPAAALAAGLAAGPAALPPTSGAVSRRAPVHPCRPRVEAPTFRMAQHLRSRVMTRTRPSGSSSRRSTSSRSVLHGLLHCRSACPAAAPAAALLTCVMMRAGVVMRMSA